MTTKAQLIEQAKNLGIPECRLNGSKAQIESAIASYNAALAEASEDTANAAQGKNLNSIETSSQNSSAKGHHPVTGPAALGAALFSALFK